MSQNYRIAVVRAFGPPENINIESHPVQPLGPGEIRVAVRTGGLNPVDARRRAGTFGGSVPLVLGTEHAGIVLESNDPGYRAGDEVIGWGASGADADLVITDASRLFPKPASLPWPLAGGLSGVGQTALTALNALQLQPGGTIVVHGAAGGVGTVLTQLAVARGYRVIGTAGAENQDYLRTLGAVPVVYGDGLAGRLAQAAGDRPVAASIDLAGSDEAGEYAAALQRSGGQAITLVPETMAYGIRLVQVRHSPDQMRELLERVEAGTLVLPVTTLPFTHIVEAHRRLDAKHSTGKLVLDLADNPYLATASAAIKQQGA